MQIQAELKRPFEVTNVLKAARIRSAEKFNRIFMTDALITKIFELDSHFVQDVISDIVETAENEPFITVIGHSAIRDAKIKIKVEAADSSKNLIIYLAGEQYGTI